MCVDVFFLVCVLLFVACRCFFFSLLLPLLSPTPPSSFLVLFLLCVHMNVVSLFLSFARCLGGCLLACSSLFYCVLPRDGIPFFFPCFAYSSWFIYSHTLTLSLSTLSSQNTYAHTHIEKHTRKTWERYVLVKEKKGGVKDKDIDSILLYDTK